MSPDVVMRPMRLPLNSVNHKLPSGPAVMPNGWLPPAGSGNSVIAPAVVLRAILLPLNSVNHRLPSGPAAMPTDRLSLVGIDELGEHAIRREPPDLVDAGFGEPDVAVGAGADREGLRTAGR